jgi:hypothetical protein
MIGQLDFTIYIVMVQKYGASLGTCWYVLLLNDYEFSLFWLV